MKPGPITEETLLAVGDMLVHRYGQGIQVEIRAILEDGNLEVHPAYSGSTILTLEQAINFFSVLHRRLVLVAHAELLRLVEAGQVLEISGAGRTLRRTARQWRRNTSRIMDLLLDVAVDVNEEVLYAREGTAVRVYRPTGKRREITELEVHLLRRETSALSAKGYAAREIDHESGRLLARALGFPSGNPLYLVYAFGEWGGRSDQLIHLSVTDQATGIVGLLGRGAFRVSDYLDAQKKGAGAGRRDIRLSEVIDDPQRRFEAGAVAALAPTALLAPKDFTGRQPLVFQLELADDPAEATAHVGQEEMGEELDWQADRDDYTDDGRFFHEAWLGGVARTIKESAGVMFRDTWFVGFRSGVTGVGENFLQPEDRETPRIVLVFDADRLARLGVRLTKEGRMTKTTRSITRVPYAGLVDESQAEVWEGLFGPSGIGAAYGLSEAQVRRVFDLESAAVLRDATGQEEALGPFGYDDALARLKALIGGTTSQLAGRFFIFLPAERRVGFATARTRPRDLETALEDTIDLSLVKKVTITVFNGDVEIKPAGPGFGSGQEETSWGKTDWPGAIHPDDMSFTLGAVWYALRDAEPSDSETGWDLDGILKRFEQGRDSESAASVLEEVAPEKVEYILSQLPQLIPAHQTGADDPSAGDIAYLTRFGIVLGIAGALSEGLIGGIIQSEMRAEQMVQLVLEIMPSQGVLQPEVFASVPLVQQQAIGTRVVDFLLRDDFVAGQEEVQARIHSFLGTLHQEAPQQVIPVVIGRQLLQEKPQLGALGGLEEYAILLEQPDPLETLFTLVERWSARFAIFVGLKQEANTFEQNALRMRIAPTTIDPTKHTFTKLILTILSRATGIKQAVIEAKTDFQQLIQDLRFLGRAA